MYESCIGVDYQGLRSGDPAWQWAVDVFPESEKQSMDVCNDPVTIQFANTTMGKADLPAAKSKWVASGFG